MKLEKKIIRGGSEVVWGSNPSPCINYAMSLPAELSSWGRRQVLNKDEYK